MIDNKKFNKLYSLLKEKSPNTINKLIQTKEELEITENLSEIKIFDKSILYWSGILNNENLMREILNTKSTNREQEISTLINQLCHNKNPNLILMLIENTKSITTELKNNIINEIIKPTATNCYRQENIHIISKFIEQNASENQKREFIRAAVEKFNKPLLSELIEISGWKQIIKEELKTSLKPFIEKIHKHYIDKIQSNQELKEYLQDRELNKYSNTDNIVFTNITNNKTKAEVKIKETIDKEVTQVPTEDTEIENPMIKVPQIIKKRKKHVNV